jgi:hypothetical protein
MEGKCLDFYPVIIHPSRYLVFGKPISFNPRNPMGRERQRLKELIKDTITAVYLQLEKGNISGVQSSTRR